MTALLPTQIHEATRRPRAVGPYLLSEPIATGSVATVHLAVHANDGRSVFAVKKLHASLDEHSVRVLMDEAKVGAAIQHKNVVRTYGCQVVDASNVFVVMEYVPGVSLFDALQRSHGIISPRIAAAVVANVLRGLHAAHEARDGAGASLGVVHRDVCPQNILLGLDGIPRIIDFRTALGAHRSHRTQAGEIKGKLAYMAPEQLLAQAIDRRADIHSAGVVLWELLAGGPLFQGADEEVTVAQALEGCNTPPSHYNFEVPQGLDAIALRAMELDPARRFQTTLEMADALDALFAQHPVTAREIGTWVAALGYNAISEHSSLQVELQRHAVMPTAADPTLKTPKHARPRSRRAPPPKRPTIELVAVVMLVIASALLGAAAMRFFSDQSDGTRANVNRTVSGRRLASTVTIMRSSPRT